MNYPLEVLFHKLPSAIASFHMTSYWFTATISRPEQLQVFLQDQSRVVYAGIDPTADSLHVGHILPMMCLVHFQIHGHKIIPLVSNVNKLTIIYLISL